MCKVLEIFSYILIFTDSKCLVLWFNLNLHHVKNHMLVLYLHANLNLLLLIRWPHVYNVVGVKFKFHITITKYENMLRPFLWKIVWLKYHTESDVAIPYL